MKILIAGGNGYVGRELVRQLIGVHEVHIADDLRSGEGRLSGLGLSNSQLHRTNLLEPDATARLVAAVSPDVIINLAAIHYIPECEAAPGMAIATNVAACASLLLAAPLHTRFIFASSGAVYAPAEHPLDEETSAVAPSDVYGFTKVHAEEFVRHYARTRGLATVVVRLFNVVGPGETNPHLLPDVVAQLKAGRLQLTLGDLSTRRDYNHVRDVARGFAMAATQGEVRPATTVTVNLGTGIAYSGYELLERLRIASGVDFSVKRDESRVRAVDRPVLVASNTRIAAHFGWTPELGIDDALRDVWADPDLPTSLVARYSD